MTTEIVKNALERVYCINKSLEFMQQILVIYSKKRKL